MSWQSSLTLNPVPLMEAPLPLHSSPADPDHLRRQSETMLRDLAFVLHLTRRVKKEMLEKKSLERNNPDREPEGW